MQTESCVYTKKFWTLHETHELQGDEGLGKSIELLQCDPTYNTYHLHDIQNCDHDI